MRIVPLCTVLLAIAGCASQDGVASGAKSPVTVVASSNTELTAQTKLHCHKETPPGSNVIQNVCETEQSEADRQRMQDQIQTNQGNVAAHQGIGH